ncbi:MAG: alcohol dehydrogenase catalytic domain-containing protein [Novosphingobium sp.]|nr:alcohol dehydrogenase catalytic domain-containing protein [Novosphingobium sp.]
MSYAAIRIARFGGPEVLELSTISELPAPAPGQLRIKVLAAGTGFTDVFIRRGRYPDVKCPLPFIRGYEAVGVVDALGPGVAYPALGTCVADLGVTGGYAQYALCPADRVVPVPGGIDPGKAACIPLAYVTAYQMLVRVRQLPERATVLVIGGSGTVGTALLDLGSGPIKGIPTTPMI